MPRQEFQSHDPFRSNQTKSAGQPQAFKFPGNPHENPEPNEPLPRAGSAPVSSSQRPAPVPMSQSSRSTPYQFSNLANSTESLKHGKRIPHRASHANLRVPTESTHKRTVSQPNGHATPADFSSSRSASQSGQRSVSSSQGTPEPATDGSTWSCDACKNSIRLDHTRINCTVCHNYDLCLTCFQANRTSLGHKSDHAVRHVIRTHVIFSEDLVSPSETVNPTHSTIAGTQVKVSDWTVEDNTRWLQLRKYDKHARYLAANIKPGHYAVEIVLEFRLSPNLTLAHIEQIQKEGVGKLRIAIGPPKTKDLFLRERFLENSDLAEKLFASRLDRKYNLKAKDGALQLELRGVLHVESKANANSQLGVLLQWSEIKGFPGSDDSIVNMSLDQVR